MKCYRVGGAVRDRLLGRPVKDTDWVVVGATPGDMLAQGYKAVGKDFPVFLHPETGEEYALARTERKAGRGHTGFVFHAEPDVSLEADLGRRDLTVNAMAEDADGTLVDPYGGRADLEAHVLRHVSPAFEEDPLRVLRAARFAAVLDFTIAPETLALMRRMAESGELGTLSAERVQQELARALASERPRRFVETLRECGALAAVFPELEALFGVPQREQYHPEIDTGEHVLMVLDQVARLSEDVAVRFAALVHDLGKAVTPADRLPGHRGHEQAGKPLVEGLCAQLKVPRAWRELAVTVCLHHLRCHRALELDAGTLLELLEGADALRRPERFEAFLQACEADARGRLGFETSPYPQADFLREARRVAAAVDVAPLVEAGFSGAALGERLHQARIAALEALDKRPYRR